MTDYGQKPQPSFDHRDLSKQKRKSARIRVNLPATYQLGKVPAQFECVIIDIGTGGIAIQAKTLFYKGDELTLRFKIDSNAMVIQGKVLRTTGKNIIVVYDNIPERERNIIQKQIDSFFYKEVK
jgi:ribosomal protein L35AE/L33A